MYNPTTSVANIKMSSKRIRLGNMRLIHQIPGQ
jgi:hypothetical protein